MAKVKRGVPAKKRHKKIIKMAKGYQGRSKNCYRIALQRVEKALQYANRDRKNKKRDLKALWIQRINAAVRAYGIKYSAFMNMLKKHNIIANRKTLSEMAINEKDSFKVLVKKVSS